MLLNTSYQVMSNKAGADSMLINTRSIDKIGQAIQASSLRQEVISNNIANAEVPNFKRSEVRFEQLLQQELHTYKSTFVGYRTDPRHFVIGGTQRNGMPQPEVVTDHSTAMNNNGNNVDLDYEMALLAKNQLYYNTLIQQLNGKFNKFRTVINSKG